MGHPTPRFPTTDDALELFFPGQKISLKPFADGPQVSFTICKLSTPVTKGIVVLAKPDVGGSEQVVIKIFDPRYLDERITHNSSFPWNFATEHAAVMERTKNPDRSYEELYNIIYSNSPEDLSGEDLTTRLATRNLFWEDIRALKGSAIPRLIMTGEFLPLDERAIRPPALVLEYVPSVCLYDVPFDAITPAMRSQVLSAIESFTLHGVLHNDLTLTNIRFTPPGKPVNGFILDFGLARIRREKDDDEEEWTSLGASAVRLARKILEDEAFRPPSYEGRISRFK